MSDGASDAYREERREQWARHEAKPSVELLYHIDRSHKAFVFAPSRAAMVQISDDIKTLQQNLAVMTAYRGHSPRSYIPIKDEQLNRLHSYFLEEARIDKANLGEAAYYISQFTRDPDTSFSRSIFYDKPVNIYEGSTRFGALVNLTMAAPGFEGKRDELKTRLENTLTVTDMNSLNSTSDPLDGSELAYILEKSGLRELYPHR